MAKADKAGDRRPTADTRETKAAGFPHYDQVLRAYDELIASGDIAQRTDQEHVEQDKGLLTRRGGYYSHQIDPNIGILKKTTGNNALGYSVDLLIHRNGTFWDVATDSAGLAAPVNGGPLGPDPALAADGWTQPTAALAGLTDDAGGDDVWNGQSFEDDKAVQFGLACNDTYTESGAAIDPGMIGVHSARCAFDYYVGGMGWAACLEKHTNAFRAEYGLPPLEAA